MKTRLQCPKCSGRKIWRVEKLSYYERDHSTLVKRLLRLAVDRNKAHASEQSTWNRVMYGDDTVYGAGHFDAYTCAGCGYSELYAQDFQALDHNPASGVHLMDGTQSASWPKM